MKTTLCVTLAVFAALQNLSHGAITYDGFDYTVGQTLAGNPDWVSANTGTAPIIAAGSLSGSGLPASTGQKVQFASGNIQEALGTLNTFNSDSAFFSLAFQLTAVPTAATYTFGLATQNTNFGATVYLQADGTDGFNIGISNRSNSTPTYSLTKFTLNTTYVIVGAYTFVTGATTNDSSSLWINPDPATFGLANAPTPTLSVTGGNDLTAITQFLLRGAAGSPSGEFDELRIGSSWQGVTTAVPEPSALAGILGGIGMLSLRRRSRLA